MLKLHTYKWSGFKDNFYHTKLGLHCECCITITTTNAKNCLENSNSSFSGTVLDLQYRYHQVHVFFYKKIFYKKMSLKKPQTPRKCLESLEPQMSELQLFKSWYIE